MLLKSKITTTQIYSEDWFQGRLAKITSSNFHFLMDKEGIGSAGINYLYRLVGEELKGTPSRKEISTDATEHGHEYEPENLREFGKIMGLEFLITQKLLIDGPRVGSTPDALIPIRESTDKTSWQVETVEAKCPVADDKFIHLWNCTTPEQLKRVNKIYYWQVIHQMKVADALKGYLSIYNPFYRAGKQRIIEFRKMELVTEFKLAEARTTEAIQIFNTQRDKMLAA